MFSRILVCILLAFTSSAAKSAAPKPAPLPDYAGLYAFDTLAGSPVSGLRNSDNYDDYGRTDLVAYHAPSAIISDGHAEIVADTANGVLRLVQGPLVGYLLNRYQLNGSTELPNTISFSAPSGLALTTERVLYIADSGANRIHRYILPTDFAPGRLTLFAGDGKAGHVNATGRQARFQAPSALAVDQTGNVFVSDTGNHVIRKISPSGAVTTLAGAPGKSGSVDGKGTKARFFSPRGIATDSAGNLYVSDTGNHVIRVITPDGRVSTLAGLAGTAGTQNGTGSSARFSSPHGLRVLPDGKLVVADTGNHAIRLITPRGAVTTLAGTPGVPGRADGPADEASFKAPSDLTLRPDGTVRIVDTLNHCLRDLSIARVVSTHSGLSGGPGSVDGAGATARLDHPASLSIADETLFVADVGNQSIRRIALSEGDADANVATLAHLHLDPGAGLAACANGDRVYVSDPLMHTLRLVGISDGLVEAFAGSVNDPGTGDGPGPLARFNSPRGLAVTSDGVLYVADSGSHTIRRYHPDQERIETFAGQAGVAGTLDGEAKQATFHTPWALALGPDDTLYVLDRGTGAIRRVTPEGVVSTRYVDTGNHFSETSTLAVDGDGNIIVGDTRNRLFFLPRDGTLGVLIDEKIGAGSEDDWLVRYENNQAVQTARVNHPGAVCFGPGDTLYIADTGNSTIRRGRPPMHNLTSSYIRVDNTGRDIPILASAPVRILSGDLPSAVNLYGPESNNLYPRFYRFFPALPAIPDVYPCTLRAELHDYVRSRTVDLHVLPTNQTITPTPLYFTYDGTPKIPAIETAEGLVLNQVLYNGSPVPPSDFGQYTLEVVYTANGAIGKKSFIMIIHQADYPRVTLPSGPLVADGAPFNPFAGQPFADDYVFTILTGPATASGNRVTLLGAGEIRVGYSIATAGNYCGYASSGTIPATAAPETQTATISLGGLDTLYDGESKTVTFTTEPAGLDVLVRYPNAHLADAENGLPFRAGNHEVEAFVTTPGYTGRVQGILKIAKAAATISATARPAFIYDGKAYWPDIITAPAGLAVKVRVDGNHQSESSGIGVGTHTIAIELFDPNHTAEPVSFTQTVLKRPLTIRPQPAHRPVGTENPPITYLYTGLVQNGTPPPMAAPIIDAGSDSPPGVYGVTPRFSGTSTSWWHQYYDITLLDGTLEVHAHQGRYQTLLTAEDTGLPEALLTVDLAGPTGIFTGTLRYRDEKFSLRGRLAYATDPANPGIALASWRLPYRIKGLAGQDRLRLELTLSDTLHARLLSYPEIKRAPVKDAPLVHVSELDLAAALVPPKKGGVTYVGRHTLLLRQPAWFQDDDSAMPPRPVGPGYATGVIDTRGSLSLRGILGDGRTFTASLSSDATHTYRLFINPYGRPDSFLAGWLPLQPHPTLPARLHLPAADDQEIYWRKSPSARDVAHRAGFPPLTLTATLDPWVRPTTQFFATGIPAMPSALVSPTAYMTVELVDIDERTGLFTQRATVHDATLSESLGDPALTQRTFRIKGVLRQPPPGDDIVGAGLIILPVPGVKTDNVSTGELLLRD